MLFILRDTEIRDESDSEADAGQIDQIGDGSLSGGEALEGLDFAGEMDTNFIIIVNDNDMSIAENHGGLYRNLKLLRDTDGKAECNLFRAMSLDYVFVKDGNDISSLIAAFRQVKDSTKPVAVHIVTQKGKGYELAEQHKEQWHWCMPFDPATGKPVGSFDGDGDYGTFTANYLQGKMAADPSVCGGACQKGRLQGETNTVSGEAFRFASLPLPSGQ